MSSPVNATTSIVNQWLSRLAMATGSAEDTAAQVAGLTDDALLARIISGDHEALEHLINRHARAVYSCIRHRVRQPDLADDLFQETWIRVIERCHTYRTGNAVMPWLYRIAINVVTDNSRHNLAQRRGGAADHVPMETAELTSAAETPGADEILMQNQQRAALHSAVMTLPEPFGEVVRLRYFEELSVAEVAEVLSCAEGTVKSRLSRGLALLQKSMEARP